MTGKFTDVGTITNFKHCRTENKDEQNAFFYVSVAEFVSFYHQFYGNTSTTRAVIIKGY
jgi:hypothetical protein